MVISERAVVVGSGVVLGLVVLTAAVIQLRNPSHAPATTGGPSVALGAERIQTISTGAEVDLVATLPDQGRTVVEFTAEW